MKPVIITIDLESVLIPEIWIELAERTGIEKLRITTRDFSDYRELMDMRLKVLEEHGLTLHDIQKIANEVEPLEGAVEFLNWLKEQFQVIIVSDTFYEFAKPVLPKLENTLIFCHSLIIDANGRILGYNLREGGEKKNAVKALQQIGFWVTAIGDSFNDVDMLQAADRGLFLHASPVVADKYPHLLSAQNYEEARELLRSVRFESNQAL